MAQAYAAGGGGLRDYNNSHVVRNNQHFNTIDYAQPYSKQAKSINDYYDLHKQQNLHNSIAMNPGHAALATLIPPNNN